MTLATHERAVAVGTRAAAARVINEVITNGRFLDTAIEEQRRAAAKDHVSAPLLQELAYGTLRWYHRLRGMTTYLLDRPFKTKDADVEALLLIGLYQLNFLRVAPHAAVDTTVAATELLNKTWAKGLLNACLRRAMRETTQLETAISKDLQHQFSHPLWMIEELRRTYPQDWQRILQANNERPPMALRVNLARISRDEYARKLAEAGLTARSHLLCASALILETPIGVERLPGFDQGWVSVQDVAAQLAAMWLKAQTGERVLDACAAPGGKAAHILESAPALQELVAIDIEPARISRMRSGFSRLGVMPTVIAADASEPSWWDGTPFDRILVDAPCSATGVIRRHPDIKVRREPAELALLCETQRRLLDAVWPCLKPGGKLLYVTCSIFEQENARQMHAFIERHRDAAAMPLAADLNWQRQILPGEQDMDGFYYACVQKR